MVGGDGYSAPISMVRMPLPEQKVAGSREMATTSAWRLATQKPPAWLWAIGASARRRA